MIKKPRRTILILTLCFCVAALSGILPFQIYGTQWNNEAPSGIHPVSEKVLRVGYPIQSGLTMRDQDGILSGYTYDYLMEISQYTGWHYEFVFIDAPINEQITTLMEMLKKGEIDLMGGMYYDDSLANWYNYSNHCYGINYSGLFVPTDSTLRESSIYNIEHLKVGVHSKSMKQSAKLQQFAQMNNLDIEQVVTAVSSEFYDLIESGRADALLSTDLACADRQELYPIARFSPVPFYFATTKGKTGIVEQLDFALDTIDLVNPDFMQHLHNEYFSPQSENLLFSEQEKKFMESSGVLEVVMYDNKPPFQYINKATGEAAGITVEILEAISDASGLSFHYNTVSSYEDYIKFIQSGQADIAADALTNYQDAINLDSSLTMPWCSLPVTLVLKDSQTITADSRIAAPHFFKNIIRSKTKNITFYNSVEECMQAVKNGSADYCIVDEFCSQYLFNTLAFEDLKMVHQPDIANQNICFAISHASDLNLLTILNKCIISLPKEMVNDIIYRNTYQQPATLFMILKSSSNLVIALVMTLLVVILLISQYLKTRQQRRIAFENKRYSVISNMANDYFYEYNLQKDTLSLSEKCAGYFHCEPIIVNFSKQLSERKPEECWGIWQLGDYIISNMEGNWEISCQMPDNTRQWFALFSTVIRNEKSQVYTVGKIADIQEAKSEQVRLARQASLDGLTGIYNISAFKRHMVSHLEQFSENAPCAFLILDIDNFKQINDTFGHYNGDAVLVQGADLISKAFLSSLVGRLGGDEFVVFVRKMQPDELETQCRLLCEALMEKTKILLGASFSWSIGIALAKPGQTYEELYMEADSALYETKSTTKNGYTIFQ